MQRGGLSERDLAPARARSGSWTGDGEVKELAQLIVRRRGDVPTIWRGQVIKLYQAAIKPHTQAPSQLRQELIILGRGCDGVEAQHGSVARLAAN